MNLILLFIEIYYLSGRHEYTSYKNRVKFIPLIFITKAKILKIQPDSNFEERKNDYKKQGKVFFLDKLWPRNLQCLTLLQLNIFTYTQAQMHSHPKHITERDQRITMWNTHRLNR